MLETPVFRFKWVLPQRPDVTTSQAKLVLSLSALIAAVAAWLASYFLFTGTGFTRTAALFGISWLLLARYDRLLRTVSAENPINGNVVGGIFVVWLFLILAAVLLAQSAGYKVPTGRGINRPLSVIVLVLPLLGVIGWRFRQMYDYLGRPGP